MTLLASDSPRDRLDLGFLLERVPGEQSSPSYRGVDRLPFCPEDIEVLPSACEGVWDTYYESVENEQLFCDVGLANRLQNQLKLANVEVEIIYASLDRVPADLERFPRGALWKQLLEESLQPVQRRQLQLPGVPAEAVFLGFDISHPVPTFHSALYQPGLETVEPNFRRYLNLHGLVPTSDVAQDLMARANELDYGVLPFCALAVWAVSPSPRPVRIARESDRQLER